MSSAREYGVYVASQALLDIIILLGAVPSNAVAQRYVSEVPLPANIGSPSRLVGNCRPPRCSWARGYLVVSALLKPFTAGERTRINGLLPRPWFVFLLDRSTYDLTT